VVSSLGSGVLFQGNMRSLHRQQLDVIDGEGSGAVYGNSVFSWAEQEEEGNAGHMAMARAPTRAGDVDAISSVVWRIQSGMGWAWLGAGLVAWKPWRSCMRWKLMVPSWLGHGSEVPSRASIWPTGQRAFSTIQDWTGWPQGLVVPLQ